MGLRADLLPRRRRKQQSVDQNSTAPAR